MESPIRLRTFAVAGVLAVTGLLAGCSGGDDATPSATVPADDTPAPTASPMAGIPDPIIVTSEGLPGGGGSEESVEYVVEAGDTLGAIAARFGVEADVIRQANEIEGDNIFVGQTLLIPREAGASPVEDDPEDEATGEPTEEPTEAPTEEPTEEPTQEPTETATEEPEETPTAPAGDGETYVVQDGDTALGIALEFDITLEALAEANGMTEEEITDLQIGQELVIPAPE